MSDTLINTLQSSIKRRQRVNRLERGLSGLSMGLGLILGFMVFDSLWSILGFQLSAEAWKIVSLPIWVRSVLFLLSLLTVIFMLNRWRLTRELKHHSLLDEAGFYEEAQAIKGNRLSNAVDFHLQDKPGTNGQDPFAQQLAERVMHRADELAPGLQSKKLIPLKPVWKHLLLLSVVVLLYLLPLILFPGASMTALHRWMMPWKVIAPISLYAPQAMISDLNPIEGDQVMVASDQHAKWHQAMIVFTDQQHPLDELSRFSQRGSWSEGRMKIVPSPGSAYYYWQDQITDQPLRFFIVSHGTWDGPHTITPRRLPRIQGLTVEIKTGDQWKQMPYPTSKRYRADAGSLIRVTAQSNREDALIDFADSSTLSHTTYIKPGPQKLKIRLKTPDDLKSPRQVELSLFGRTPDPLAGSQEPEMDESTDETTSRRIVDEANAKDGEKAEDMAKENQGKMSQMAERTGRGRALDAMERLNQMNDDAANTANEDLAEITVELAQGTTLSSTEINQGSSGDAELNASQKAPEKYRELVQSYLDLTRQDRSSTKEQP